MTKTEIIQDALNLTVDDRWGDVTDMAVAAERAASRARHGMDKKSGEEGKTPNAERRTPNGGNAEGRYSERFLKMIPFLWEWEGTKFENVPGDPGGATKYGIDQRSHPSVNIRELTEAQAIDIYWNEYWQKFSCEGHEFPLGEVVFNCCVNAGPGRAVEILKRIDRTTPPRVQARAFLAEMDGFYNRLAEQKPPMRKFLKGWLNRTAALRNHLAIT